MCLFPRAIVPSRAQSPHRRGGSRRVGRGLRADVCPRPKRSERAVAHPTRDGGRPEVRSGARARHRSPARAPALHAGRERPARCLRTSVKSSMQPSRHSPPPRSGRMGGGSRSNRCTGVRVQQPGWIALGRGWARSPRPVRAGPVRLRSAERTGELPDLGFSASSSCRRSAMASRSSSRRCKVQPSRGRTGQNYGAVARALTLKPAETRGEEFPVFRAFWLERPAPGSNAITVHGIVDSESTAGAVRMTFVRAR